MANATMQMTAGASDPASSMNDLRRTASETPNYRNQGLDTGARGWRWVMATPATRQRRGTPADNR